MYIKKSLTILFIIFVLSIVAVTSSIFIPKNSKKSPELNISKKTETEVEQKLDTQTLILKRTENIVTFLKNKNWVDLSKHISPEKGVRFSPYTFVDVAKDQVFTATQIASLNQDNQKYTWGSYDGSGLPIELNFNEYYSKFIFSKDYSHNSQISYNKSTRTGNTVNNIEDVYKNSITVEYYIPYGDPKFEGLDWSSLKLVWQEENNEWYLIGIINDCWTI